MADIEQMIELGGKMPVVGRVSPDLVLVELDGKPCEVRPGEWFEWLTPDGTVERVQWQPRQMYELKGIEVQ